MTRVFLVLFLLSLTVGVKVSAQQQAEAPQYDENKEAEIAQRAKKRIYAGGRDEEDLKVQSQISTPVRKLAPQAEIKEEPVEE